LAVVLYVLLLVVLICNILFDFFAIPPGISAIPPCVFAMPPGVSAIPVVLIVGEQ
jgi:hypothetical protein